MARPALTLRDLADLGDERFEDLVAALVIRKHPDADHLGAPDGGADVILEDDRTVVWQVKHFPHQVNWDNCEESLKTAIREHGADEVIFVFPRKVTNTLKKTFRWRLREPYPDTKVGHRSGPQVLACLRDAEDLIPEFFPETVASAEDLADRVAERLSVVPADPHVEQAARAMAAAKTDRRFDTSVELRTGAEQAKKWETDPYLTVTAVGRDGGVEISAWPAPGVEIAPPAVMFHDTAEGAAARHRAREEMAGHGKTTLTEGITLRLHLPEAARGIEGGLESMGSTGELTIQSNTRQRVTLTAELDGQTIERDIDLFAIPPAKDPSGDERALAFGRVERGLSLLLDVTITPPSTVRFDVKLSFQRDEADPAMTAESGRLMLSSRAGILTLSSDLLPEGPARVDASEGPEAEAETDWLRAIVSIYDAVTLIRDELGTVLTLPENIEPGDARLLAVVGEILRTGGGTLLIDNLVAEVPADEADAFLTRLEQTSAGRFPLREVLFGTELDLGLGEGALPPPTLVVPGPTAQGLRRYELRWSPAVRVQFKRLPPGESGRADDNVIWTPPT